jgi:hypothetical protein
VIVAGESGPFGPGELDLCAILEALDACTQIFHIALQHLDMLGMKALMPGLVECNLAHELAQVAESLLNPLKSLLDPLGPLINPLEPLINLLAQGDNLSAKALDTSVEVVAHPMDAVADLLE